MNSHADRVRIANIAQTVNVLQAMVLTDGPKMLLTPTYHVFHMYKVHQNSTLLPIHADVERFTGEGEEEVVSRFDIPLDEEGIPVISATVSRDDSGVIHVTATNTHPTEDKEVNIEFRGEEVKEIIDGSGKLLTADSVDAINTFENPENVKQVDFEDAELNNGVLKLQIPNHSVIVLSLN